MNTTKAVMSLRRDFAFEVGWYQCITTPTPASAWSQHCSANKALQPLAGALPRTYEEYCVAVGCVPVDRLTLYVMYCAVGFPELPAAYGKHFVGVLERGLMPPTNHLFRETIERVEQLHGFSRQPGSPLRPTASRDHDVVSQRCLIHDRISGLVYLVDWVEGLKLVRGQLGGSFEETRVALWGNSNGGQS